MKGLDLTQGNVSGVLFRFAVPYLIANILQALYGGADLFVVGQYNDAASVAGVSIGSQVMQTVTGIILGLTAGLTRHPCTGWAWPLPFRRSCLS